MKELRVWRVAAFLLPLMLALPFMNRAFFVDDSYFVEISRWLTHNPGHPYDFKADDAGLENHGWEANGFVRMVNPLVHQYYVAAWMRAWNVFGSNEAPVWLLRLACVLLSCGSALILFELGRRWTFHPMLAVLVAILTPAFWLSSYSLLIDPTMTFFSLLGLYLLIRGLEKDSPALACAAGVSIGLAILSKYPALFVLVLVVTWVALNAPTFKHGLRLLPALIIPLVMLVAYSAYTAYLYGSPHILAASARMVHMAAWPKLLVLLVFFSGSLLLPLLAWIYAPNRIKGFSGLIGLAVFALMAGSVGGFTPLQAVLIGAWLATALAFFLSLSMNGIGRALPYLESRSYSQLWIFIRDHRIDAFLGVWAVGFMMMMMVVMGWVAVRYYCLVVPAIAFLVVRTCEQRWPDRATKTLLAISGALFVFGSALAYADYKQAEPARRIGKYLLEQGYEQRGQRFYLGDSFTMSYLKSYGWIPAFPDTEFKTGDLVLSKDITMPQVWFFHKPLQLKLVGVSDFPSHFPLKVMDFQGSAGFYASVWGALPYTWSWDSWERFRLFEVTDVQRS